MTSRLGSISRARNLRACYFQMLCIHIAIKHTHGHIQENDGTESRINNKSELKRYELLEMSEVDENVMDECLLDKLLAQSEFHTGTTCCVAATVFASILCKANGLHTKKKYSIRARARISQG